MIKAAIVGLGKWGQNLVTSVQGRSEHIRFVAGVLRHPEKAREYANAQGLELYDDYRAVLADPAIDAIVLATPHTTHAEQILQAIDAGKPVFTEKPFTLDSKSARQALDAAAKKGLTLAVGFNWRFQPALNEIRAMLEDGRLGRLLHIEGNFCGPSVYRFGKAHWRQQREEGPAGGMTGRGIHVVDAMLYLAGHVDHVHAQSYRLAHDYGIDDTTSMLFRFATGATGYLGTVIATAETWRMQVFGSKGWVEVGDVEHLTTWQMKVCYVDPENLHTHQRPRVVTFRETSTERAELEHFAQAVQQRLALALPGGDEEHGVAVLEAILESAASGATVSVARPDEGAKAPKKSRAGASARERYTDKKEIRMAAKKKARKATKKRLRGQTEATHEPLSGARPARKPLKRPAQRKSVAKKPSKALKKAVAKRAPRKSASRRTTKGGVARPGISRKPPGRSKRR